MHSKHILPEQEMASLSHISKIKASSKYVDTLAPVQNKFVKLD